MNDLTKTKEELVKVVEEQRQEIESIKALLNQSLSEKNDILFLLEERSKEIKYQNLISAILTEYKRSIADVCQNIVNIIPPVCQFPEHTSASITVNDQAFYSPGFRKSSHHISEQIKAGTSDIGCIDVYFTGEEVQKGVEVFRSKELDLLRTIALRLGIFFETSSFYQNKRETDERINIITEASLDAIILIDNHGNISFWNPAAERLLGYSKEEVLGCNMHKLLAPANYHEAFEKAFETFRQTGEGPVINKILELEAIKKDGQELFIELSISKIKIDDCWNAVGFIRDITQRKQAELSLRQSEQNYRNLIENINDVIYEIDLEGNIRFISSPIERIIGYKPEEIIGKNFLDFVGANAEFLATRFSLLKEQPEIYNEYKIPTQSGEYRWIRLSTKAIYRNNEMTGAFGTLYDITEKKQLDIELQKSEALHKSILQASPDSIFISDLNGNILFTSPMADKMFGLEKGVLLPGQSLYRLIAPRDHSKAQETIKLMKTGNFSGATEYLGVKSDGTTFEMEVNGEFIRDNEGNPTSIVFIVRDISERKQTEEKLYESEARYKTFFEGINSIMLLIDPETNAIVDANPAASKFYGWSREQLCSMKMSDINTLSPEEISAALQLSKESKRQYFEFKHRLSNGKIRDVEVYSGPVKFGESTLVHAIIHDITERKQVEEKLIESEARFRMIFENVFDGISIFEENEEPQKRRLVDCNEQYAVMAGRSRGELLKIEYTYSLTKTIEENANELRIKGLEEQTAYHGSFKWLRPDGKDNTIEYIAKPIKFQGKSYSIGIDRDITEAKQKENQLRRLSQAVEQSPVSIVITSLDGKIEYANPQACKTTGYTLDELTGENPRVLKSGETTSVEYQNLWNTISNGKQWKGIFHNKRKNGELYWESSQISPIVDKNGQIINYLAVKEDISEQKRIEEELAEREAELNFAQKIANMGSWTLNLKTNKMNWSENYYRMLGLDIYQGDIPSDYFFQMLHPEDNHLMDTMLEEMLNTREQVSYDMRIKTSDGKIKWMQNNIVPVFERNSLTMLKGVNIDITEKKIAEEKVKLQNEQLSAIINAIPDLIFITDQEGTYLEHFKSHQSEKLIIPEDQLIGTNFRDIFDEETANLHIEKTIECLNTQQLVTYEYALEQEGNRTYYEARLVPMANKNILRFIRDFTDKRLKDNELRKLSHAIEQSPVSIVITDLNANIQYVNPSFTTTSGYSYTEIVGQNTKILKSGLTGKEVYTNLWDTITKGLTWKNEWINRKKNGDLYWESISITPIYDDLGKLINYLAVKQDITERKKAEQEIRELNLSLEERIDKRTSELAEANASLMKQIEVRKIAELALAQSEKSYRMVVENVAEVIFQTDTNGLWVFLNNSWETITGFSVKESIGQLFNDYVHPEDRLENRKEFDSMITHKKDFYQQEIRYLTKDGGFRWIEVYAKLGFDENNTVIGTYGTLQDITDRKLAEEMVHLQKERLESIIEGSSLCTWEWNVQTGETIFNHKWAELIGYTLDELQPLNIETWVKYVHPDDQARSEKLLEQHFNKETDFYVCEVRMKHKDGNWVWVLDSGKVISWTDDGKPLRMFGSHHDITERKKAEIFENEILQLSPKLTGIPLNEIDSAINLALSRIGKVLDADRSYIFEFSENFNYASNTYEWCNDGISQQINDLQNIQTELFPDIMDKLKKLEYVVIESVTDLPETWKSEREIFEPQEIMSLVMIPMVVDNNLIGFVGLDSIKEKRSYTLTEINILKIWSSMLSSLINNQRAEKLLEQTRQNYETFFNTIDDFLFVFNEDGIIVDINQTVVKRLGYNIQDILNQQITKFRPEERRVEAMEVMQKILLGQQSTCTIPLLTRSKVQIPVETKLKRGFWNGNPVIFGISKDISQIKLSEQKFASAFHSSSAVMTINSFEDGLFIDVNKAFTNTLGYSKNEIIGKTLRQIGVIRDIDIEDSIKSTINQGNPIRDLEIKVFSKSNEQYIFLLSAEEIYVGLERCVLSVAIDITTRKRTEEQLQWNKSLLEMMSNSSPMGFLVIDNQTDNILYFNKRFCQIWGIEHLETPMARGEIRSYDLIPYCLPVLADGKEFIEASNALRDKNNRDIVSDEIHFTNNRTIHRYSTQIRGFDDKYYGRFYIFEDITEEKRAEEELRNARNEAERANIAKSEFLSRMSHELRTPMNSILGFAQLLEMGELNPGQLKGVNHIMKSGKHLLDLINEVLDISRIESGRLSLSLEPVQLSSIIPEMTDFIKLQAAERQITVKIVDSPNNQLFVKSDRQRIKQVILNLLNNAIKYNREGGSISIKVDSRPEQMVRISITDSGYGIAPEFVPKLFTPFERIGADKSNIEGTGLGLSVVKKLMEAMGGRYGIDSIQHEGSTFWIELPMVESQLKMAGKLGDLDTNNSKIDGKTGTILYIEDNQSNVELVEQILISQRTDIELITNSFGKQAIPLALKHRPDIILLDLNLPDTHGSIVLQELQSIEETRNIPVIIITADAMPHQHKKLLASGAKKYLTKPLNIPEFLSLIQDYLPEKNT